ncbi:MAG: efflux RND transporter permease subunit, partial [Proteobacteria bacterium]|nr:efflux RND transporter permease subunit [Pseudomonadota bacterium]
MSSLLEGILSRTKTNISILIFCIIFGFISYLTISKESTPDVKVPYIYVSAPYSGISPQDAERLILRPLEQQIKNIEGIKQLKSTGYEGGGNVIIEFKAGGSIDKSLSDVREKVARAKSDLPKDISEPAVSEINLALFPILTLKLSGDLPLPTIYKIADQLKLDIESNVSSVLSVDIAGNQEESVEVIVDPSELSRLNLSFSKILLNVSNYNQMLTSGYVDTENGRMNLKISGTIENIKDILDLPIYAHGSSSILLKDIADIRKTYKDQTSIVYDRIVKGVSKKAVLLSIKKRIGENLIDTVSNVKALVESKKETFPPGMTLSYAMDESDDIKDMLKELQNNIIFAIILVMGVIVAALGRSSALLVGIAVPGSFLMGILALSFLGATLNIVVLFSLIFSIGMLVDGAIIVVEYADRLISEEKMPHKLAYLEASKRMFWPVITSISTILV